MIIFTINLIFGKYFNNNLDKFQNFKNQYTNAGKLP